MRWHRRSWGTWAIVRCPCRGHHARMGRCDRWPLVFHRRQAHLDPGSGHRHAGGQPYPGRLCAPLFQLRRAAGRSRTRPDRVDDADQRGYGAFAHRSRSVLFVGRADAGLAPLRPADKLTPERRTRHRCPTTQLSPPPQQTAPVGWEPELAELRARIALAKEMGGEERVARQHQGGRLTVRERIDRMLDAGSFHEIGSHRRQGDVRRGQPARSPRSCRPTACSAAARWMAARWWSPATTSPCAADRRMPRSRASRRCRSRSRPSSACRSSG